MISIKEILEYMKSGKTFSVKVVSYDRKRKKGGEEKYYPEAILATQQNQKKEGRTQTSIELQKEKLAAIQKNPNHRKWYTRNIRILQEGHYTSIIKTVHPPLFIEFNGKKVVP